MSGLARFVPTGPVETEVDNSKIGKTTKLVWRSRRYRTLNIIDEITKEALVIRVKRKLDFVVVVDALTDLFILRGPPEYRRSDNGAEFIPKKVRA